MAIAFSDSTGEIRADDIKPSSLQDFFDLERFPGPRGLRRTPMTNLEWALLADGVPGDKVYSLLRTEAGVARAFAKLATIRDDIVWWEDATRSEEHTSELQSLMRISYAVFCLKKKKKTTTNITTQETAPPPTTHLRARQSTRT